MIRTQMISSKHHSVKPRWICSSDDKLSFTTLHLLKISQKVLKQIQSAAWGLVLETVLRGELIIAEKRPTTEHILGKMFENGKLLAKFTIQNTSY